MGVKWLDYPKHKPAENGYYMTEYVNSEGERYHKAIYWDTWLWVRWRMDIEIIIEKFLPETRSEYYTECIQNANRKQE